MAVFGLLYLQKVEGSKWGWGLPPGLCHAYSFFFLDVLCAMIQGVVCCILEMVYLHRKAEFVPEPPLCIDFCSGGWNLIVFFC